jgi:hypothetical protein
VSSVHLSIIDTTVFLWSLCEERKFRKISDFGDFEFSEQSDPPLRYSVKSFWAELVALVNQLNKTEVQELATLFQSLNGIYTEAGYRKAIDEVFSVEKRKARLLAAARKGLDNLGARGATVFSSYISANPLELTSIRAEIAVEMCGVEVVFRCQQTYNYTEETPGAGDQLLSANDDNSDNLSSVTGRISATDDVRSIISSFFSGLSGILTGVSANKQTTNGSFASGT